MKILRTGSKECFDDLPILINWTLTMRCNYLCSYCFNRNLIKNISPNVPFPTLEQLKIAVDNIVSLNRPWYNITLVGGEPTIHPHISELITILHETLGNRLNRLSIITNGSRNEKLYKKLAEHAKSMDLGLVISLHTDHVDMSHILNLIENLSADVDMQFLLMFNPAKREFVHEIYDMMLEYKKKYWFTMSVVTLREGDRVDPRYTPEDFAWQKKATKQFQELAKSVAPNFPPRRKRQHLTQVIRDIEDNGEVKTTMLKNRTLELADGLLKFKGMYCIAHACVLHIDSRGGFKGLVCADDHIIGNIYEENSIMKIRDKLIHSVRCTKPICGCPANDIVPKFASEDAAKKYLEFAQNRQAELFAEYEQQAYKFIQTQ